MVRAAQEGVIVPLAKNMSRKFFAVLRARSDSRGPPRFRRYDACTDTDMKTDDPLFDGDILCAGCGVLLTEEALRGREAFLGKDGELYCCKICSEGKACECGGKHYEKAQESYGPLRTPKPAR